VLSVVHPQGLHPIHHIASGTLDAIKVADLFRSQFGSIRLSSWRRPQGTLSSSGEWIRTFAIVTTDANELVADIHDRMPLILAPSDYARRLSEEPDPRVLMRPFPASPMRIWPISTRVNTPENDDPSIVKPIA
jgi:putative SOS response-associated peptidase YedK